MKTLEKELKKTILKYYQGKFSDSSPKFYVTKQWNRLIKRKVEAEADNFLIESLKEILLKKFPMFSCKNGLTFLGYDSCYSLVILLHKGIKYDRDERDLIEIIGRPLRYMDILISVLVPFYHFHVTEMSCINKEKDEHDFKKVTQFNVKEHQIIKTIRLFMQQRGYKELPKNIANKKLCKAYTQMNSNADPTVFDCLFSEMPFLSP